MRVNPFFLMLAAAALLASCTSTQTQQSAASIESAAVAPSPAATAPGVTVTVLNDSIPSPRKQLVASIDSVTLTITWGSPAVKGRKLWGQLVPYEQVWRSGANEATTFEVSAPVQISGKTLPAGKYSFFTIPGEQDWTVIFNSVAEQWGAYEYDAKQDVLRFKALPQPAPQMAETLEFTLLEGNRVALLWGDLMLPFEVAAN
jgi:hypothetical protein